MLKLHEFFPHGASRAETLARWDCEFAQSADEGAALFVGMPGPGGNLYAVVQGVPFKCLGDVSSFLIADSPLQFVHQDDEMVIEMGQYPNYVTRAFEHLERLSRLAVVLSPGMELHPCLMGFEHTLRNLPKPGFSRILDTSSVPWTLRGTKQ